MGIWNTRLDKYVESSLGRYTGRLPYPKFGKVDNVGANVITDIWNGPTITYNFTAGVIGQAGVPYYISSSNINDTQNVYVQGLDEKGFYQEYIVTLNGQTPVRIGDTFLWFRFWRGQNRGTTNFAGLIYIYENSTVTAGVPDDLTLVRGFINDGENQTQMAILSSPINEQAIVESVAIGIANKVQASVIFTVYARLSGSVFTLQGSYTLNSVGTGIFERTIYIGRPIPPGTDIVIKVNSGTSGVAIGAEFDLKRRVLF